MLSFLQEYYRIFLSLTLSYKILFVLTTVVGAMFLILLFLTGYITYFLSNPNLLDIMLGFAGLLSTVFFGFAILSLEHYKTMKLEIDKNIFKKEILNFKRVLGVVLGVGLPVFLLPYLQESQKYLNSWQLVIIFILLTSYVVAIVYLFRILQKMLQIIIDDEYSQGVRVKYLKNEKNIYVLKSIFSDQSENFDSFVLNNKARIFKYLLHRNDLDTVYSFIFKLLKTINKDKSHVYNGCDVEDILNMIGKIYDQENLTRSKNSLFIEQDLAIVLKNSLKYNTDWSILIRHLVENTGKLNKDINKDDYYTTFFCFRFGDDNRYAHVLEFMPSIYENQVVSRGVTDMSVNLTQTFKENQAQVVSLVEYFKNRVYLTGENYKILIQRLELVCLQHKFDTSPKTS